MAILQPTIQNISAISPQPIVGQINIDSQPSNTIFYSSPLLNYVESIEINGVLKTCFFSEVNTNVNVGDRVFIINGNYDSNDFSKTNKYKKYSDGYRVLSVNGCRIVLDIDYNGALPFKDYTSRDFIYIHHIDNQKDFDYINTLTGVHNNTLKSIFFGELFTSDLRIYFQDIIYCSATFSNSTDPFSLNGGIDKTGFWIRRDDGVNNFWNLVTDEVISNQITQSPDFSTSGRLFILGKSFSFDSFEFESNMIYKYENRKWIKDVTYKKSFISKSNFRSGKFRGTLNDGIFGSYEKKNRWTNSFWNSGVMINSDWVDGIMYSKHTIQEKSFNSRLENSNGVLIPLESVDTNDNRGFGYNFIEKSNFYTYSIFNGNFYDCLFNKKVDYKSALDSYFGYTSSQTNVVNGGKYDYCELYDTRGNNGYFLNSTLNNINLRNSKLISSEVLKSSMEGGYWSADGGIKILGADVWSYDYSEGEFIDSPTSNLYGTLKLYISEQDYFKLSKGDVFYISKLNKESILNFLTDDEKILTNLETKFLIDNYFDYDILNGVKTDMKISLSPSSENQFSHNVSVSYEEDGFSLKTDSFSASYEFALYDSTTEYWSNIDPVTLRGVYNPSMNDSYYWGDVVYNFDSFYKFLPFDREFAPSLILRANSQIETDQFFNKTDTNGSPWLRTELEPDPVFAISDWVFIGTYSGQWSKDGIYQGTYLQEASNGVFTQPIFASGSVVSNYAEILTSDKFWIFVGQNTVDQSYSGGGFGIGLENLGISIEQDIPNQTTNAYRQVLTDIQYKSKNFFYTNNIKLPSINISSKLFGFYTNRSTYIKTNLNVFPFLNKNNVNNLFVNTILSNGDFKSGIMSESNWLSGDNTNYLNNVIKKNTFGDYDIMVDQSQSQSKKSLKVVINNTRYSDDLNIKYEGYDFEIGDYVWINSIINEGNTPQSKKVIKGKFRVLKYFMNTGELLLESGESSDIIESLEVGSRFYLDQGSKNRYLSIGKFNINKSLIESGKFRRTTINDSTFYNELFKKYEYPTSNILNNEKLRIVNIFFKDTGNIIKSGYVYKSHFANDTFDGATLYDSFWLNGTFSDGLVKYSVWVDGTFNGGKFVDSRSTIDTTFDFDTSQNIRLWQDGIFNNGEFYNSLWVRGTFNGGRFLLSDWTGGVWNNGILGSKTLRAKDTTLAYFSPATNFGDTHTVWNNGIVENALVGGFGYLDWYNGKMLGGEFSSSLRDQNTQANWYNGEFYGSTFKGLAWWKNGKFYSGKFLSTIGSSLNNFLIHSNDPNDYGWVSGEFIGGEFGSGNTAVDSCWYDGVMKGGVFQGRFWRMGVLVNGKFYGSLATQSEMQNSITPFGTDFYGLWNDGYVTDTLSDVKRDQLIVTEETTTKNIKKNLKIVDMYNVLWKSGTFSSELSTINDSVWLDGEFKAGNFNNSYFNPYVDIQLKPYTISEYSLKEVTKKLYLDLKSTLENQSGYLSSSDWQSVGKILTFALGTDPQFMVRDVIFPRMFQVTQDLGLDFTIVGNSENDGYLDYKTSQSFFYSENDFYDPNEQISALTKTFNTSLVIKVYSSSLSQKYQDEFFYLIVNTNQEDPNLPGFLGFDIKIFYPRIDDVNTYSFNLNNTCVWKNGNFYGGEFNYSIWENGNFNDGIMLGAIWKNGTFNYGKMLNSYWEKGVWRNGTWDGSPFDSTSLIQGTTNWSISDDKISQIIKNIGLAGATLSNGGSPLHINNVVTSDVNLSVIHSHDQNNYANRWFVEETPIT